MSLLSAIAKPWCKQLSNGMKVFIDDIAIMGKSKRIITIFGKNNTGDDVLLHTRMKEYVTKCKYYNPEQTWVLAPNKMLQTTDINRYYSEFNPVVTQRTRVNYGPNNCGAYTQTYVDDITKQNLTNEELMPPLNVFQYV